MLLLIDVLFNLMLIFYSFGLIGGVFLLINLGILVICYLMLFQVKIIVKCVVEIGVIIFFVIDIFINQYVCVVDKFDLFSLCMVVCGVEWVKDEIWIMFKDKFEVDIVEGYGFIEVVFVFVVNQFDVNKFGIVGCFLFGVKVKLIFVNGIDDGGQFYILGFNIMCGYICLLVFLVLEELVDGWYDIGDIVVIDDEGFFRICG